MAESLLIFALTAVNILNKLAAVRIKLNSSICLAHYLIIELSVILGISLNAILMGSDTFY